MPSCRDSHKQNSTESLHTAIVASAYNHNLESRSLMKTNTQPSLRPAQHAHSCRPTPTDKTFHSSAGFTAPHLRYMHHTYNNTVHAANIQQHSTCSKHTPTQYMHHTYTNTVHAANIQQHSTCITHTPTQYMQQTYNTVHAANIHQHSTCITHTPTQYMYV